MSVEDAIRNFDLLKQGYLAAFGALAETLSKLGILYPYSVLATERDKELHPGASDEELHNLMTERIRSTRDNIVLARNAFNLLEQGGTTYEELQDRRRAYHEIQRILENHTLDLDCGILATDNERDRFGPEIVNIMDIRMSDAFVKVLRNLQALKPATKLTIDEVTALGHGRQDPELN